MLFHFGLNPELTTTLGRLLFCQLTAIIIISAYRYEVKRREYEIRRSVARDYQHL